MIFFLFFENRGVCNWFFSWNRPKTENQQQQRKEKKSVSVQENRQKERSRASLGIVFSPEKQRNEKNM